MRDLIYAEFKYCLISTLNYLKQQALKNYLKDKTTVQKSYM